jgi:hypothetical protein
MIGRVYFRRNWEGVARGGKGWQGVARGGKGWQGVAKESYVEIETMGVER